MANYRTTVILKTDIVDSTPRLAGQTQAEMGLHRKQHKQFISETAAKHHGLVFQEEGDAYLMEFPSVTNACLAAIEMHQNLRLMQTGKGEQQRLAIRAIITVGDILYQGSDTIGMTMSLTARIEKITPADETYLSQAAWLALNKAEVQTSLVGEFDFKGFGEPGKVYKLDQKTGVRLLNNLYIVFVDANGFSNLYTTHGTDIVEKFLLEYEDLISDICKKHNGTIRQVNGDMFFLTFENADQAVTAIKMLCLNWKSIREQYKVGIKIGVHKGSFHVFHSYVFGEDINITVRLTDLGGLFASARDQIFVIFSGTAKDDINIELNDTAFQELDTEKIYPEKYKATVRGLGAYRLTAE